MAPSAPPKAPLVFFCVVLTKRDPLRSCIGPGLRYSTFYLIKYTGAGGNQTISHNLVMHIAYY